MKSIQSKFLIMIISGMLFLAISITCISLLYIRKVMNTDSDVITESVADTEALRISHYLKDVQYLITTMQNYTSLTLRGRADTLRDEAQRQEFTKNAQTAFCAPAENVEGVVSFYMRLEASFVGNEYAGFYSGKATVEATNFVEKDPYKVTDWYGTWYNIAKKRGTEVWLNPYTCYNTGMEIISYVSPIYIDGSFIGVVGVDVAFSTITDMVSEISIYDHGFAYLAASETDNTVLFTPDEHLLNRAQTKNHEFAEEHKSLENGMVLVVHADYSDIQKDSYRMTMLIVAILFVTLSCFILLAYILAKKIVRPLKEITAAAERLADGETDLHLEGCKTRDEVGILATAFEKTAEKLGGYMSYINAIAYKDALTGVKNRTAFNEMVTKFDVAMSLGNCEPFAIIVADVNGLKKTNDRYGHEIGNRHLIKAAKIICDVFKHSPVYRIGGDEFVVILKEQDFENRHELLGIMDEQYETASIMAGEETIPVTIARAMEEYDLGLDFSFNDVFNRADIKMYEHKNSQSQRDNEV